MKTTKIIYWVSTILFAGFMLLSSIPYVISSANVVKMVSGQLGYPAYMIPFLGVAKIIGSIVLLIPGFPRLKEWAYAGMTFDLLGATYSCMIFNEPKGSWLFMIIFFIPLVVSYIYYHKKLNYEQQAIHN